LLGAATRPLPAAFASRQLEARYDVEAAILLFGVPVFRRRGVGEAWFRWEAKGKEAEVEFLAGSVPARARGLNRLGYFHERVDHDSASYFGFMTSSKEETFESARKALEPGPGAAVPYAVSEGQLEWNRQVCREAFVWMPSSVTVRNAQQAMEEVRQRFDAQTEVRVKEDNAGFAPRTFLRTVMEASCEDKPVRADYLFNNHRFTLNSEMTPDGTLMRMQGRIYNHTSRQTSVFQLWRKPGREPELPERFEYQPKSFLRLSFHRMRADSQPLTD
jgi:hypothetical protein